MGKVEYWLFVAVLAILLLVVRVVAVGIGEEGLVTTAISNPPATCTYMYTDDKRLLDNTRRYSV